MTSNLIFGMNFKNKIFNFPAGPEPEIETGSLLAVGSREPEMASNERA